MADHESRTKVEYNKPGSPVALTKLRLHGMTRSLISASKIMFGCFLNERSEYNQQQKGQAPIHRNEIVPVPKIQKYFHPCKSIFSCWARRDSPLV
jgi:hypothetical protein